jgi:DNA helicase-4
MSKSKDESPPPPPVDDSERRRLLALWKKRVTRIKRANSMLANYLSNDTGYFSNYQENYWLSQHKKLLNEISGQSYGNIGLNDSDINAIKKFISHYKDTSSLRKKFNVSFVNSEIKTYSDFFDNIEERELDSQQRKAVVTDEDNNLIIAGAGSGKTTTIVGKVHYILDRYKVKPEEVLLISYTRRSADSLRKRLKKDEVKVKTFHGFGMEVLKEVEGKSPKTLDDDDDSKVFKYLLTKLFKASLEDRKYINKVNKFVTDYLRQPKSEFDFKTKGDYYQYLRDQDFSTFKRVPSYRSKKTGKTTFNREVVKSIEECKIANFLLFNGVEYKYEAEYIHPTSFRYLPDFSLIQDGKTIYLEHFGINKNNEVPPFFANEGETHKQATKRYLDDRDKKIKLHKGNSTTLIQTFSYEIWQNDENFYEVLKQRLIDAGIRLNPKTPEEIWQIINDFYRNEEKGLIKLFSTFITLMKSNQYSIAEIKHKAEKIEDGFLRKRSQLFLDIIKPIYDGYEAHLAKEKVIDFSDMINKATKYISSRKYKKKISYVIIDEFQDISIGRYNLVKEIKKSNPSCRLFCVGDDWQSIYRFTGSDIALFKDFSKYFGVTEKLKIETTYRFHNPLIDLSSQFIQQNPNQAKKELHSADSNKKTNYQIKHSRKDDTSTLIDIFNELVGIYDDVEDKKITILARHNFDLENRIKNEDNILSIDKKNNISYPAQTEDGDIKNIRANFQSVHSAKGLEADVVIIINCNAGKYGFPNQMADDPTLNLLLSEADQFENGEERRLFYVAMTRAKEMLYFITDSYKKSKFILEIETESGQGTQMKCPICKTGDINPHLDEAKNGNRFIGYNCSNWMYKCPGKGMVFEDKPNWIEDDWIRFSKN